MLAIERSMSAFEANEASIFANEGELQKLVRGVRTKAFKKVKKAAICLHPGCNSQSVVGSHTIHKAASLKTTADNGHLRSPTGIAFKGSWLGKIGYQKASVFTGFCKIHENFYQEFESSMDFQNERQICRQLFRTLCREISVNTEVAAELSAMLKEYIQFRNRKLDESLFAERAKLNLDQGISAVKKTRYRFNNGVVHYLKDYLKRTQTYLRTLEKLKKAAYHDIVVGKDEQFYYHGAMLDWEIPISLAGKGTLKFKSGDTITKIDLIINILPYEGKTYLLAGSFYKYKKMISLYIENYAGSPFNLIMLAETWMLYGSDHWFLQPAVWDALDVAVQEAVRVEIYESNKNILAVPEIMIFKQARLDLIALYKSLGPEYATITGQLEALMKG